MPHVARYVYGMNKSSPLGDAALRIIRISLKVALRAIQAALSQIEPKPEPEPLPERFGICPKSGMRYPLPPPEMPADRN
jgi:hypothetical protein